jgi:hypothetical protein
MQNNVAYITFVALWSAPYRVLAVDYNSYFIANHFPINWTEGK